jgi:lipoprotein-anchoring transpeptidase ErfK/SrfK
MFRSRCFLFIFLAALMFGAGSAAASVQIAIDKASQRMTVSVNGVPKYVWLVSTGGRGYATPSGSYTPFRMEPDHYSKEWDDAPMPHSIFFTPVGHAIHGSPHTKRLGSPVSHGCVRLAPNNAAILYALVEKAGMRNTRVVVTGGGSGFGFFSQSSPQQIKKPNWATSFWGTPRRRASQWGSFPGSRQLGSRQ